MREGTQRNEGVNVERKKQGWRGEVEGEMERRKEVEKWIWGLFL